jgi:cytochrome c556
MRALCVAALALWVVGAGIVGWFFVKGWTVPGTDKRMEVRLAPSERDLILAEMRQLLKAVHGVVTGLSETDRATGMATVEEEARKAGMAMAADVNPAVMMKLPLPFKQMGTSVHRSFDELADGIAQGEDAARILVRLSSITSRCTTCHELYRLPERP